MLWAALVYLTGHCGFLNITFFFYYYGFIDFLLIRNREFYGFRHPWPSLTQKSAMDCVLALHNHMISISKYWQKCSLALSLQSMTEMIGGRFHACDKQLWYSCSRLCEIIVQHWYMSINFLKDKLQVKVNECVCNPAIIKCQKLLHAIMWFTLQNRWWTCYRPVCYKHEDL